MPHKHMPFMLWAALATLVGAGTLVTILNSQSASSSFRRREPALANGMPPAPAPPPERLKSMPTNGAAAPQSPGSAGEAAFLQRAFPDGEIRAERIDNARRSPGFHRSKGFPRGGSRRGAWGLIGPSEAVYPFFALRTSALYVPHEDVAAGRATSLALPGDCEPGDCTPYAEP